MHHKALKTEYILTIILLLVFFEPLLANNVNTGDWRQGSRILPTRLLSSDSSLPVRYAGLKKYAYAELLYQVHFSIPKFILTGTTVSPELKTAVNTARYRDDALDLLGDSGWELVSVITRNFDGGFELFFYFKKPID